MRITSRMAPAAGCGLMLALLAGSALAAGSPAPAPGDPGVWQKHQYSFAFFGFTSTYSCDGLASKLQILLIASGARSDSKARPGACASDFGRPDKFARADLTFYTLAPANADSSAAAPTANGGSSAAAPTVNGIWRPVTLTAHEPRELSVGDCELVEQFKANVLPMLTTRNVDSHTTCVPHQESGSVIDLKFESFSAPQPNHAGSPTPSAAAGSGSPTASSAAGSDSRGARS